MTPRRILVTGTDGALGATVAARLRRNPDLVVVEQPARYLGYDDIAARVLEQRPDTIVHCHVVRGSAAAVDVIGTMRVAAAAAQPGGTVRRVVVASSSEIYPASSSAPRLHCEAEVIRPRPGTVAARLIEAEGYVRALAEANPHICVAVLRLADLTGVEPQGALARLLLGSSPLVPAVTGFDPPIQLLDFDDAAAALEHAAACSLVGVYNVSGTGSMPWSSAVRLAGKRTRPVAGVLPPPMLALAQRVGVPVLAPEVLDTLRFGRTVDTQAFEATGFVPTRSIEACARRHPIA